MKRFSMKRLFILPIRVQIFLIAALLAVFAIGVMTYSGLSQRNQIIFDAKQETQSLAAVMARQQQALVLATEQLLTLLSKMPELKNRNIPRLEIMFRDIMKMHPEFSTIFITNHIGEIWASALPTKSLKISDMESFDKAVANGRFSSGQYKKGQYSGKQILSFYYPYHGEKGEIAGVIILGIDLNYYRQLLSDIKVPTNFNYLLLDHNGMILSGGTTPNFIGQKYKEQAFSRMQNGPATETSIEVGMDGQKRFISYQKLIFKGEREPYMYVRAGLPVDFALAKANRMLIHNLSIFIPSLLLIFFLVWLLGKRSIADRISLLEKSSLRLADGDLSVRVADLVPGGELGNLGRTFDHMAQQLSMREHDLRESEKAAKRLATENGLIADLGRILSSTLKIEEVYDHFANEVRKAIAFDRLSINTVNIKDNTRTIRHVKDDGLSEQRIGTVLPLTAKFIKECVRTRSGMLINSENRERISRDVPGILSSIRFKSQSSMIIPLISEGEAFGTLAFHSTKADAYSENDLRLAERVGNQIAGAIANAELFRKRILAEKALQESTHQIQVIADNVPALISYIGSDLHYRFANKLYEKLEDISTTEVVGKHIREVMGEEYYTAQLEKIQTALSGKEVSFEANHLPKNGKQIILSVHYIPDIDSEGSVTGFYVFAVDITARKHAEESIRQNEEFIRNVLDTVDEGFVVIDPDYRILTANKAYCNQHASNCDDVIGRHCYEISHKLNRPCYEEGEECAVKKAFATGKPYMAMHKHPGSDGQMIYVETKAFPIKDASGKVISTIETINNITEKHLLEEEQLKTQKLESIGLLAGGIAHDFNNLLQGVFGYINMAKMTFDKKDKALDMLEQAEKALHQSVNLTDQLLTFSKGGNPAKKPMSLKLVIEKTVRFALSGSKSDFHFEVDPELWHVNGDAGQLGQVIHNIVLNADQSMPLGGVVNVAARNLTADDSALPSSLAKGSYVELLIKDSGVGIPKQYLDKIFDPYFTTKEKGSGLGLATCYSIIRNHGGQIYVTSEVGKGTVFSLYLPALTEFSTSEEGKRTIPPTATHARVLVMDDEEMIRDLVTQVLSVLGNGVEVAADGESTLAKYKEAAAAGRPFDVVILDLTIRGGMGGLETIRKLVDIDPGVKAIVSSGYSDDNAIANFEEHGFKAFLKKPYNMRELQSVLQAVLSK